MKNGRDCGRDCRGKGIVEGKIGRSGRGEVRDCWWRGGRRVGVMGSGTGEV
jgi:hypothetical protein